MVKEIVMMISTVADGTDHASVISTTPPRRLKRYCRSFARHARRLWYTLCRCRHGDPHARKTGPWRLSLLRCLLFAFFTVAAALFFIPFATPETMKYSPLNGDCAARLSRAPGDFYDISNFYGTTVPRVSAKWEVGEDGSQWAAPGARKGHLGALATFGRSIYERSDTVTILPDNRPRSSSRHAATSHKGYVECKEANLLDRLFLPRSAAPWALTEGPAATSAKNAEALRVVNVVATDASKGLRTYFCGDMANASQPSTGEKGLRPKGAECALYCADGARLGYASPTASFDVDLAEVDAGLVYAENYSGRGDGDGGAATDAPRRRQLTRDDLFECRMLQGFSEEQWKSAALNEADVWLAHYADGLPYFWRGGATVDGDPVTTKARLLPLVTAFVYGESTLSFDDYAGSAHYLSQFDLLYTHFADGPNNLYPRVSPRERGVAPRHQQWALAHVYQSDFEVILHLNRVHQRLLDNSTDADAGSDHSSGSLHSRAHRAASNLHALESHLLPLVPPASVERLRRLNLSSGDPRASTAGVATSTLAGVAVEDWQQRKSAIAAFISGCWHNRLRWLQEINTRYPVHNYGRCNTAKLPKHTIPDRCSRLRHTPKRKGKRLHKGRDYELRCVVQDYKYYLAFENTVEKDYVTEKVYNALLSGAIPIYIGGTNIADFVPLLPSRLHPGGPSLSVIDAVRMFGLLDETEWRNERERLGSLRVAEEAAIAHLASQRFPPAVSSKLFFAPPPQSSSEWERYHLFRADDASPPAAVTAPGTTPVCDSHFAMFRPASSVGEGQVGPCGEVLATKSRQLRSKFTVNRKSIRDWELPLSKEGFSPAGAKANSLSVFFTKPTRKPDGDTGADGFRAMGTFLHLLETSPQYIEQYLSWWSATDVSQWGTLFTEKLFLSEPICGVCNAALTLKRKRMGNDAAQSLTVES